MQTGKETTQTHTVSLDSEEHNLSDSQWKTGVRARFPWTGFIALSTVVLCAVSSVVVLLVSDGKSQIHWSKKIAPNVLLSGFNGIANICFGVAIANGVAITWWRKALKGATIQDLHRSWAFSSSIKDIVFYGKYFNFIALAALAAKLTIIDGILLQRATSTVVGDDPGRNITIDAWANTTMPYTGVIGGRSNDVSYLLDWFNSDLSIWSEAGGVAPAWSMYSCEGTCVLDIVGTGFEIDCKSENVTMDYGAAAVQDAIALSQSNDTSPFNGQYYYSLFDIEFDVVYGATGIDGDYSKILMNITSTNATSHDSNSGSCPGTLTRHVCTLRPALIKYPVTIQDNTMTERNPNYYVSNVYLGYNTSSFAGLLDANVSAYNATTKQQDGYTVMGYKDVLEDHPASAEPRTAIGGIAKVLNHYFAGSSSMHADGVMGFLVEQNGSAEIDFNTVALTSRGCDFQYADPLDHILQKINSLMFTLTIDPWSMETENVDRDDFTKWITVNATQYGSSIHYKTNRSYMFGALASMLVCVLCVLPSYYGYWQLGRDVTLGPFEIANAFRAPVLDHPAVANAGVKDLIREVGKREVKYGEMVQNDAPSRLAIAEPDAVRRVHPKINDRRW
ncbi:hypothetical protein D6C92_04001 [Aureobasidium pullulans]|nr:hypothetical protein D6C92_04001 [Aureobasidium pullulans]